MYTLMSLHTHMHKDTHAHSSVHHFLSFVLPLGWHLSMRNKLHVVKQSMHIGDLVTYIFKSNSCPFRIAIFLPLLNSRWPAGLRTKPLHFILPEKSQNKKFLEDAS